MSSGVSVTPPLARSRDPSGARTAAGYADALILTVTVCVATCLVATAVALLLVHPDLTGLRAFASVVNQQNQSAKTGLYLVGFFVILPVALVAVPRLADEIARGPNGQDLRGLVVGLAVALAGAIVLVRVSARLPWGDGLGVLLVAVGVWSVLAAAILARAVRSGDWPLRARLSAVLTPRAPGLVWASLLALLLCVTNFGGLAVTAVVVGAVAAAAILLRGRRLAPLRPRRSIGAMVDVLVVVLLLLAVPDAVIFTTSGAIPNSFFEPGIIQFQQDWILGPANQLLGGGPLLVNAPVSQYGVGMLYFLAGWFHLAPIGYGTFGALDGILTALFYAGGYGLLRLARVPRLLAIAALAVAVVALIYDLRYPVGALPEQGPLRFGLPMALMLPLVAAVRWPRHAPALRVAALVVLAVSALWALENFAYTAATFAAMTAATAWLEPAGQRLRLARRQLLLGVAACLAAHVVFAVVTLAAGGQPPHWGRYLAYLHALLLGGKEGSITYGFDHWSPGVAVAAASLASAAAIVLLMARAPAVARRDGPVLTALAGTTAYSIAVFSYADNRSATYLLLYIGLPLLLAGTLWLRLLITTEGAAAYRSGGIALSLAVAVLLIAGAWSTAGPRFDRSALAHAYPGGGLRAAVHRLWHPPPIDPRAPDGDRLLARYVPGPRPIVVLPAAQDLSIEILMRAHKSNRLFIGDGYMDSFVPSVWRPVIARQLARLHTGDRLLLDRTAVSIFAHARADPSSNLLAHPIEGGASQEEWVIQALSRRFDLRPVASDRAGLVVAALAPRR